MRLRTRMLGLAGTLLGSPAAAEVPTPAAAIDWEAPENCPDEMAVVRQVESLLGAMSQHASPEPLHFLGRVHAEPGPHYRLLLRVSGGSEELARELTHSNCDKLTEAASLVIALAIDPERVQAAQRERSPAGTAPSGENAVSGEERNAEPSVRASGAPAVAPAPTQAGAPGSVRHAGLPALHAEAPAGSTPVPPSVTPPIEASSPTNTAPLPPVANSPAAVEMVPSPHQNVAVVVSGGAVAGGGVLPNTSFGAELGFGASFAAIATLGAFVELWAPSEEPIADAPGATLRMRQVTLGMRGCWSPELGGLNGLGCVAGEIAQLTGEGRDVAGAREDGATWAGIRAELGVLLPLSPGSFLTAGGAGGLSLTRPRFGLVAEDGTEVNAFQPSSWYVRSKVGVLFTFE